MTLFSVFLSILLKKVVGKEYHFFDKLVGDYFLGISTIYKNVR